MPPARRAETGRARGFVVAMLLSLGLNLLLGCYLLRQDSKSPSKVEDSDFRSQAPAKNQPTTTSKTSARTVTLFAGWDTIYSDNPREYAARLRACGCPEQTVKAIISAKLYGMREEQCAALGEPPLLSTGAEYREAKARIFRRRLEIISKTDELGREILGARYIEEAPRFSDFILQEALFRFLTGRMRDDGWEDFLILCKRCEQLDNALSDLSPLAAFRERQRLVQWVSAAEQELLTPAERQEESERIAAFFIGTTQERDHGFNLTAEELRKAAKTLVSVEQELLFCNLMLLSDKDPEERLQEQVEYALKNSLSPERCREMMLRADEDCKAVLDLVKEGPDATSVARNLHRTKSSAEEAWARVLQSSSSEQEKHQEIATIRAAARESLNSLPSSVQRELEQRRPAWAFTPERKQ